MILSSPDKTGLTTHTLDLSSALVQLQHKVTVLTCVDAVLNKEQVHFLRQFKQNGGKSPVKYVFSATSSTSIFVPKNETYDDTRRSCRNYYVLQGTQSNL